MSEKTREMVLMLNGNHQWSMPCSREEEKQLSADFLERMNEVDFVEGARATRWYGLTFVNAWLVGFYFRDAASSPESLARQQIELTKRMADNQEIVIAMEREKAGT